MNEIRIPLLNDENSSEIHFYADELPEDDSVLIDVLRDVLAPLKIWRSCAIEYYRQGMDVHFDSVLHEIVNALLNNPDIMALYQQREDYTEGITEIYVALASKALSDLTRARRTQLNTVKLEDPQAIRDRQEHLGALSRQVVDYLKKADDLMRINEYTWLIKGFFEIMQGDIQRAESQFRAVYDRAAKGQQQKKKFLFGALIGLGIVAFSRNQFTQALQHFTMAVQANATASGVTVRLAIASCCFKLEQYDRAKLALEKCFSLDPTNCNLLVMMALVELAIAKKDRNQRVQCRQRALEYSVLANAINPSHASALNLIANHHFHSWKVVKFSDGCYGLDATHMLVPLASAEDAFEVGNQLRINCDEVIIYTIVGVSDTIDALPREAEETLFRLLPASESALKEHGFLVLKIDPPIPASKRSQTESDSQRLHKINDLGIKQLLHVQRLALQALGCSSISKLRAESYYILGKVAHVKRDTDTAIEFYYKALKEHPEMALAAFGAAQILFCKEEFAPALELFDKVLKRKPDDKDTQAYVMLLKTILRGEKANFEKLKEVAPGFQFEVDLWLTQAQLRQQNVSEHAESLRCYMSARDSVLQRQTVGGLKISPLPPDALSNISALNHSLGKLDVALDFIKQSIVAHREKETIDNEQPTFSSADLEGVYYEWSENPAFFVKVDMETNLFSVVTDSSNITEVDLTTSLTVGDEVLIAGVKHVVHSVAASTTECYSPVRLEVVLSEPLAEQTLPLHTKISYNNFNDSTIIYSYNFARLLEDDGCTTAASEIYTELLKRHPSFIECYLRLSMMASSIGRFDEASMWATRAIALNPTNSEAILCLGDLLVQNNQLEDAKRCYERNCSQGRHDVRSLLSLGNFYFSSSMNNGSNEGQMNKGLKESYKFFFHALKEHSHNAYGANGLAMVCVQKGEMDVARDILVKAREAEMPSSEHINTNLAHLYLIQNRASDAERLYLATCRRLITAPISFSADSGGKSVTDKAAYLHECAGYSQYRIGTARYDDSMRSLLRSLHLNPTNMRVWYNVAIIGQAIGNRIVSSKEKGSSVEDIVEALSCTELAQKVFQHLSTVSFGKKSAPYDKQQAATFAHRCEDILNMLEERRIEVAEVMAEEEALRREKEERHNEELRKKKLKEEEEARKEAAAKQEKQKAAAAKAHELELLKEKWTTSQPSVTDAGDIADGNDDKKKTSRAKGIKKRKRNRQDGIDSAANGASNFEEQSGNEMDEDDLLVQMAMGKSSIVENEASVSGKDHDTAEMASLFGDDSEEDDFHSKKLHSDTTEGNKRLRKTVLEDDDDIFGTSDADE